jgi:uncharacterized protein
MRDPKSINFILKISKFCNLRCSYCYEYNELGVRRRMSLHQLRTLFESVRSWAHRHGDCRLNFIWHGGEPFLIPLDYYEQIGALQHEIFGTAISHSNWVQTNLTVLTDRHVEFLRQKRFFAGIGVSFDVSGDQRVDTRGRSSTQIVLKNIQRLRDADVRFGAITVLARNTLANLLEIYRFYDLLGISVRFLPFYKNASGSQVEQHALSFEEISGGLKQLFDAWLVSERATPIIPLQSYLRYALAFVGAARHSTYDPLADEGAFLVDTDGATYGHADTYVPELLYGNVFSESFDDILAAPTRALANENNRERMSRHCSSCEFFGYCTGQYVADATKEQRRMLSDRGCPVREVLTHMVRRLNESGVSARIASRPDGVQNEEPALTVDA